jgi:hypothetical protein
VIWSSAGIFSGAIGTAMKSSSEIFNKMVQLNLRRTTLKAASAGLDEHPSLDSVNETDCRNYSLIMEDDILAQIRQTASSSPSMSSL